MGNKKENTKLVTALTNQTKEDNFFKYGQWKNCKANTYLCFVQSALDSGMYSITEESFLPGETYQRYDGYFTMEQLEKHFDFIPFEEVHELKNKAKEELVDLFHKICMHDTIYFSKDKNPGDIGFCVTVTRMFMCLDKLFLTIKKSNMLNNDVECEIIEINNHDFFREYVPNEKIVDFLD